jgi:hypothetical protein
MFQAEASAARAKLLRRTINFKKANGYVRPDKMIDGHMLTLIGAKKTSGNQAWFDEWIDSKEFHDHFDSWTLTDHDDFGEIGTPPPSALAKRIWGAFTE